MSDKEIRFDDGAAYEEFMGKWSQLAGDEFLAWLAPSRGWRWADIGCGNGAFTEMLVQRHAPAFVHGIDPSPEQLAYARQRFTDAPVEFEVGDAMALPYADASFDAAVMALVIFFVPGPAKSVAEMARIVKPGGSVSAYAWDIRGGGFPFAPVQQQMAEQGITPIYPPSADASKMDSLIALWQGAGLTDLQTREIQVQRTFANFDAFWKVAQSGPRIAPTLSGMAAEARSQLREGVRARLAAAADGTITCNAKANAIKGVRPA